MYGTSVKTNEPLLWNKGFLSGRESACQCRRHKRRGFDPWIRKILWKRKWQPTSVFLPGESHGHRSLAGYSPWGRKWVNVTMRLNNNKCHIKPQHSLFRQLLPGYQDIKSWKWSRSVLSNSLWTNGLQPTRLLCPWDFPGKSTRVGCYFLLQELSAYDYREIWLIKLSAKWEALLSNCTEMLGLNGHQAIPCLCVSQLSGIPWTVARQAPLSMGSPRQEYWRGLPFPPPGDLPNTGIEPASLRLAVGFCPTAPTGKLLNQFHNNLYLSPPKG